MKKVLVAGATGYLGGHLVNELKRRGFWVRVLVRSEKQKERFNNVDDIFVGSITKPETLKGITKDIDWVFTTIGITRQKDGLTYMDVDYKGNSNLLDEALKTKVETFLYVSAINGDKHRNLKIFEAKERFVDELKASGLNYKIMRPNGFFSDMGDFLKMAKNGSVYLFGHGDFKLNPIDGEDLATVCVDAMTTNKNVLNVGGPETFTQNELATIALEAWDKKTKIRHLPDWIRKFTIWTLRTFTSVKTYGPYEFFLTAMASDNIADQYGSRTLKNYFELQVLKQKADD